MMNRGVDKREIFLDETDHVRFVHNLYEFNDANPALTFRASEIENADIVSPHLKCRDRKKTRALLVDIHGWVLMGNHYHLLLSERMEGGLTLFLRKLNIGYAKYFNEKYGRAGTLFQGRTKKVHISSEPHFLYILHYIHFNPLDYLAGSEHWRVRDKGSIKNARAAIEYLDSYRWSSYLDYAGEKNFPSILTTSLFKNKDVFKNYRREALGLLRESEFDALAGLTLE